MEINTYNAIKYSLDYHIIDLLITQDSGNQYIIFSLNDTPIFDMIKNIKKLITSKVCSCIACSCEAIKINENGIACVKIIEHTKVETELINDLIKYELTLSKTDGIKLKNLYTDIFQLLKKVHFKTILNKSESMIYFNKIRNINVKYKYVLFNMLYNKYIELKIDNIYYIHDIVDEISTDLILSPFKFEHDTLKKQNSDYPLIRLNNGQLFIYYYMNDELLEYIDEEQLKKYAHEIFMHCITFNPFPSYNSHMSINYITEHIFSLLYKYIHIDDINIQNYYNKYIFDLPVECFNNKYEYISNTLFKNQHSIHDILYIMNHIENLHPYIDYEQLINVCKKQYSNELYINFFIEHSMKPIDSKSKSAKFIKNN